MSKRQDRTRRLAVAVAVAVMYRAPRMGPRAFFKATYAVARALLWRGRRVDRWMYYRRLRWCFGCPVFFRPLRTCGSPFAADPNLGCACAMEQKAALPDATCWGNENTDLQFGWPDDLYERRP